MKYMHMKQTNYNQCSLEYLRRIQKTLHDDIIDVIAKIDEMERDNAHNRK